MSLASYLFVARLRKLGAALRAKVGANVKGTVSVFASVANKSFPVADFASKME
jgi:hypothetical protein